MTMAKWSWFNITQVIVGIWVAIVATIALKTWKHQSKAEKQAHFLDELTNAVHEFIQRLSTAKQIVRFIKIGIDSYQGLDFELNKDIENPEAVAFIGKSGKIESEKLKDALITCSPSMLKIHSLVAKGQVFDFPDYEKCQEACRMITWQYERMEAFACMISNDTMNWKNVKVQEALTKVIALEPEDIDRHIREWKSSFLIFIRDTYKSIYK